MRIALASDACAPQTNGVVTTLKATAQALATLGHQVCVLSPQTLACVPCPSLRARWPIPLGLTYAWLRRFHGAAVRTFVSSRTLEVQLAPRGFGNLHLWRRGVDTRRFRPNGGARPELAGLKRPIIARLAARYPDALFMGFRHGEELAALVASADVLVFPSLTDTFGLVMLEALACGVPVAAFPVPGPLDVVEPDVTGVLHTDLATAITSALRLDRRTCAQHAARCSWEEATAQFVAGLVPIPTALRARLAASRSFAMIARKPARRQTSGAGESL